jgi:DNA-binding XRE family transcriptional regulator
MKMSRSSAKVVSPILDGAQFASMRIGMCLSQATLGKLLGVRRETICRWERGVSRISVSAARYTEQLYRDRKRRAGEFK